MSVTHDLNVVLGKVYRDSITGFTGTCTGTCKYISGCDQVLLVPKVKDDGTYIEGHWFDDVRLVDPYTGKPVERTSERGGPQEHQAPVKS